MCDLIDDKQTGKCHLGIASWKGPHHVTHCDDGDVEELDEHEVSPLIHTSSTHDLSANEVAVFQQKSSVEELSKNKPSNKRKGRIFIPLRRSPKHRAKENLLLPDENGLRMFSEPVLFEHKSFEGTVTCDSETRHFKLTSCSLKSPLLLTHEGFMCFVKKGMRILPITDDNFYQFGRIGIR